MSKRFHLFEVTGVELEYMIVDRDSLQVRSLADELIYEVTGDYTADVERGAIGWSNELVNHVIELKTNGPAHSLEGLNDQFHQNVVDINQRLKKWNAMLLPTGTHPMMDPYTQTVIWPHEHNEVYSLYNRIFDCRGHGWANLQSTHINLPFANNEEFGRLHAAIRILLPILPALTASSPILDGKITGYQDTRLETYRHNQDRIPVIAGAVIPEAVFTEQDYEQQIFNPIKTAIAPFDTENILSKYFLNSRGAIARFDRGAIEIRIIDIQEAPVMDVAIVELVVEVLKWLVLEQGPEYDDQCAMDTEDLRDIFLEVIKTGSDTEISNAQYLELFGFKDLVSAQELLEQWYQIVKDNLLPESQLAIELILSQGNLSERILANLKVNPTPDDLIQTYRQLAIALQENKTFKP